MQSKILSPQAMCLCGKEINSMAIDKLKILDELNAAVPEASRRKSSDTAEAVAQVLEAVIERVRSGALDEDAPASVDEGTATTPETPHAASTETPSV